MLFFWIALTSYVRNEPLDLVQIIMETLDLKKSECQINLIVNKRISDSESIIVIPEIEEKGDGYLVFNSHVSVVDNKGDIKLYFYEKESLFSDAIGLSKIQIVNNPYKLRFSNFGMLIDYYGSSKPNPSSSKELSLFVIKKQSIKRVLKDYPIFTLNGETNAWDRGSIETHRRTIIPIIDKTKEFYYLKVVDSIKMWEYKNEIENVTQRLVKIDTLKYIDGSYRSKSIFFTKE